MYFQSRLIAGCKKNKLFLISAFVCMILLPSSPWAQSSGGASEAGKIQDRLERPKQKQGDVERLAVPETKPGDQETSTDKFRLIGAQLIGNTVFTLAELAPVYEPYLNQEISVAEVDKIVKAITEKYREDGYFLTRVIAPPQGAEFGILDLRIIEGFVEDVVFKGEKPGRSGLFGRWAANIKSETPLKLGTMERTLLLMADVSGIGVTPSLKEIDIERGAYRLEIALTHSAVGGFVNFDNRGTTSVGPLQVYAGVNLNSVLGFLERTRVAVFTIPQTPEELRYIEFQQDHILNSFGTQAWIFASRSVVDLGTETNFTKENSHGTRITLGLSHPVMRSRDLNLFMSLKLDAFESDKSGNNGVFDDKLRVLRVGSRFNASDNLGGTSWLSAEYSQGFDVFGASDEESGFVSNTNGRSDFIKVKADFTRVQNLVKNLDLQLSGAGQWSPHTLLSSEEFTVGGQQFGRAFDPSEISGNIGASGSAELQFNVPADLKPVLNSVQLYGFYDAGAVWGVGFTRASIISAGGGIRLALPYNFGPNSRRRCRLRGKVIVVRQNGTIRVCFLV
jgi:hemolysin activation/secretion protein